MTYLNTLSVKEILARHGDAIGVKVWKASKAKLIERIVAATPDDKPTKFVSVVALGGIAVAKTGREVGVVGAFAKSHSLNPKVLRAALRRAGYNAPYTVAQLEKLVK
jgi:hypothetical protein